MAILTIVAHIKAKQDKTDFVKSELMKLLVPSRAEAGCLLYDLHQDNDSPNHFLYFEYWKSKDDLLAHMRADHIKAFQKATKDAIDEFIVNEMSIVDFQGLSPDASKGDLSIVQEDWEEGARGELH